MPLTTGTGLTNQSDVIDAVRTHLLADGWTSVINDGTVGANDKEVWLNLPSVDTFYNQYDLTVGMMSDGVDDIDFTATYLTPSECLLLPPGSPAAGRNVFNRVLGTPNLGYNVASGFGRASGNIGDVYPQGALIGTNDSSPVRVDRFNQGASYLKHWIFTPDQSPIGGVEEVYMYCVVEVATGIFRTFGFGEGIKLGASGWTGGFFVDGSAVRSGQSAQSRYFAAGDTDHNIFGDQGERAYVLNFNNDNLFNGFAESPILWNPWMHLSDPGATGWVTGLGMGPRGLGTDWMQRGTANFSGQAIRIPARIYAMNVRFGSGDNRFRPLIEYPQVFHMNIESFDPGSTIVDDAESFLVVPYVSKTGTDNSGNNGFLIRNVNL